METIAVEIRNVRVPAAQDEAIESIAPDYLKGGKKSEARIQWALGEFLKECQQSSSATKHAAAVIDSLEFIKKQGGANADV